MGVVRSARLRLYEGSRYVGGAPQSVGHAVRVIKGCEEIVDRLHGGERRLGLRELARPQLVEQAAALLPHRLAEAGGDGQRRAVQQCCSRLRSAYSLTAS